MYNYNRDVYQAEHERQQRMMSASERQLPYHLRRDGFSQATGWLGNHVFGPTGRFLSASSAKAMRRLAVYYRRASTRAAGLVLNTLESLIEMAPGRA